MVYLTNVGISLWFFSSDSENSLMSSPEQRILNGHPVGIQVAEIAVGIQVFWDIPMCLMTPALFDPVMLLHHVGMFIVASVLAGLGSDSSLGAYYGLFFFGVIEVSSIPLAVVDVFHPKHKSWFKFLNEQQNALSSLMRVLNDLARVGFALSYLLVRAIYFPYVVFTSVLPDLLFVASLPDDDRSGASVGKIYFLAMAALGFVFLQLYWGTLVAKQLIKAIFGGSSDKKDS